MRGPCLHEQPPKTPPRLGRRRADPAAQCRRRILHFRSCRARHRRGPDRGGQNSHRRRARRPRRHRLHPLLCDKLYFHRPRGRDLFSRWAIQYRRRGAGLCRGPRRGARRALSDLPARSVAGHRRDPRRRLVWRCLRGDSRLSPSQARRPHRHHDDHVQLRRLGADGLSARRRLTRTRADERRNLPVPCQRHRAAVPCVVEAARHRLAGDAVQSFLPAGARLQRSAAGC